MPGRYLLVATITKIDHLSDPEAKEMALHHRGQGKRAELLTYEELEKMGLIGNMQDLSNYPQS